MTLKISINGTEENTVFYVDASEQEKQFMEKVTAACNQEAKMTGDYAPTMDIQQVE